MARARTEVRRLRSIEAKGGKVITGDTIDVDLESERERHERHPRSKWASDVRKADDEEGDWNTQGSDGQ